MSQVSYCIATHNNPEGLYLSVFAALEQFEKSKLDWEIVLVCDGGTPVKYEQAHPNIRCLRLTGANQKGSPQGTRDVGIRMSKYTNVLCIDSHVIVSDIEKWVHEHERLGAAISFPAMVGTSAEMFKIYGNKMDFDGQFWNILTYSQPPEGRFEPFMVCQCAHSGFMVDRAWYQESGGYTMEQRGYGGEEPYLALLAWMLGRKVWFLPQIWHAHYMPMGRNDGAGESNGFAWNFMLCAYVFGGQKYLEKIQNNFAWAPPLKITPEIQRLRNKICAGPFNGNLDALRNYFKQEKVVH
jgi:hypothetical protein